MSLMPQTPFQWFVPATTGTGLVPADGYKAKFYAAGTTTPKAIYEDAALSTPYPTPSNVAVLDSQGRALIYLGSGAYKLVITDPSDNPVYSQDNISGESSFGTGFANSFADLASVDTTLNQYTYIGGYYLPGDGGEGMFFNKTSADAADGGYIQASTFDPTKRWFRIPDENGDVRAASFGYMALTAGTQTSAMMAADAYAAANSARLLIAYGFNAEIGSMSFNAPIVRFSPNAGLHGVSSVPTIVFNGVIEAGEWAIFSRMTVTLSFHQTSIPYWFGATPGGDPGVNATAFAAWKAAGAALFVVPSGAWPHTGTFTPVSDRITVFNGSVGTRASGTFYGPASLINGNLSLDLTGNYGFTGSTEFAGNVTLLGALNQTGDQNVTGDITVTGELDVSSFIFSSSTIQGNALSSITTIQSGTEITAGTSLKAQAGTSGQNFKAAGNLFSVQTGNSSIPANTLSADGDSITIKAGGTYTGGSAADIITQITIGGVVVLTSGGAQTLGETSGSYYMEATITRNGATSAHCIGFYVWTNAIGAREAQPYSLAGNLTIDWSATKTVSAPVTGSITATQRLLRGDLFPAA